MAKSSLLLKVVFILLSLVYSYVLLGFFEIYFDAYKRGYRYIVLIAELIFIPLYTLLAIVHLIASYRIEMRITKNMVYLLLKYLGGLILALVIFFILAIMFNDASAPGARIG